MDSLVADYGSDSEQSDSSDTSDSETSFIANKKNSSNTATVESQPKKPALPPPSFDDNSGSIFINPYIEAENAKSAILEKHVKMIPSKEFITEINGKKLCWMYKKGRCRFGSNCKYAHDSELYNQDKPKSEEIPIDPNNIPTSNTQSQPTPPPPPSLQGKPPGVSYFPPHQPTKDFQTSQGGFPPSQGGFSKAQGGFLPSQGGFLPSQGGFPPSQGGFPTSQGGFPPFQGGFPTSQGGFPPFQGGFPTSQGGFPSEDNDDDNKPFLKKKRPGLSQDIVPGKKVMKMYYSSGKQGP